MTHSELVIRPEKWLRNAARCSLAFREITTGGGEIPDAIGFMGGRSVLVECKTSRADFFAERNKPHRQVGQGMGDWRYYMCEPGILKIEDMPSGWGLLHVHPKKIFVMKPSGDARMVKGKLWHEAAAFEKDSRAELYFLQSLLVRCALRWDMEEIRRYKPDDLTAVALPQEPAP